MNNNLIDAVIVSRSNQGAGIAIMELQAANGAPLPAFAAGAHIDVHVDQDTIRQYSLCNDPMSTASYRIGVLNDPNSRGGSVKIFNHFTAQQNIKISAPRNHFPLDKSATKTLLVGGGIGITPLLAMAYELARDELDFELHYCTRTRSAGAFQDELVEQFGDRVHFHVDDEDVSQRLQPKSLLRNHDNGTHLYVCGPSGFMDWLIGEAENAGLPSSQVHFEYFSAEVDKSGDSFEVYCQQSDISVQVSSEQSIAEALDKAGIPVYLSCAEGICGTCITDVLEGEPDHRDHFLTEEEKSDNDQIALCCSRAKSGRLVLDL